MATSEPRVRAAGAWFGAALHRPGRAHTGSNHVWQQNRRLAGQIAQMTEELRYYGRQAARTGAASAGKEFGDASIGVGGLRGDVAGGRGSASADALLDAREDALDARYAADQSDQAPDAAQILNLGQSYKWKAPTGSRVRRFRASNGADVVFRMPASMDPNDPAQYAAMAEAGIISHKEAERRIALAQSGVSVDEDDKSGPAAAPAVAPQSQAGSDVSSVAGEAIDDAASRQTELSRAAFQDLFRRPGLAADGLSAGGGRGDPMADAAGINSQDAAPDSPGAASTDGAPLPVALVDFADESRLLRSNRG